MKSKFLIIVCLLTCSAAADGPLASIRGRVIEEETGQLVPCSVSIRLPDGSILTDNAGYKEGFRSAGQFEKKVPAGALSITVKRGFDYTAQSRQLTLGAGEQIEIAFSLRRRSPLRKQGWYTGDSHVHMIHGERQVPSDFASVALAGQAEGLDYMAVAQNWPLQNVTPVNLEAACRAVSTPQFHLTWNLESPKNYYRGDASRVLGHGWTVGMRGYTADGRDALAELMAMSAHDYESEKPPTPNFEIQALIHELGGITAYSHTARWWRGRWGGQGAYPVEENKFISNLAQELPFDTVIGPTYEGIDILMRTHEARANQDAQRLWFMLLNHGYRIAGTASSDATFDRPGGAVPGSVRMYTRVDGPFTLDRLRDGMAAGRNFVTSGPLLHFTIGGHEAGDAIKITRPQKFKVAIETWADDPVRIELIRNGETRKVTDREFDIEESGSAWYIVKAVGSTPDRIAISNPIYFETADESRPHPAMADVTVNVTDERGAPVDATCEVLHASGRRMVIDSTHALHHGTTKLHVSPTARLRISAPGHAAVVRSIFLDTPELLRPTLDMRVEQLLDWNTYERMRATLRDIKFDVQLR